MINFNGTFDWKYYINKHKLMEKNIINESDALEHWSNIGKDNNLICRYIKNDITYYSGKF